MKKTTKMAAVLAAMSVMVIGAVSTTMAANEGWNGNDDDGWTYVQDGVKVKGWQQIDGFWYYFDKSGNMAQDELVTVSGQTYYLSETGIMATGWHRFDSDHDIYEELEDDFPENYNNRVGDSTVIDDNYLYEDEIWLYFDQHGVAAEDKWVKSDAGLWYYFEDLVMVRSDYSYKIDNDYYGLDENGAMMVGWIRNNEDSRNDSPYGRDDTKAWYYYQSNGKQVVVDSGDEGKWKKVDGTTWYYFISSDDPVKNNSILTSTYTKIDDDYFYLNGDGKMATGITKVAKDTTITGATDVTSQTTVGDTIDVYFESNGRVESGFKGDSYYITEENDENTLQFEKKGTIPSGETFEGYVKGQLAKNCFVRDGGDLYYIDKYGEKIKNESLEIKYEDGREYKIVFGSNGKAIRGKDVDDKVKAGKTYTVEEPGEIEININGTTVKVNVFK